MHPSVLGSTVYNCQVMKATSVSINWWMDKKDIYVYIYLYIYSHNTTQTKRAWNLAICINVDQLGGNYAKS